MTLSCCGIAGKVLPGPVKDLKFTKNQQRVKFKGHYRMEKELATLMDDIQNNPKGIGRMYPLTPLVQSLQRTEEYKVNGQTVLTVFPTAII